MNPGLYLEFDTEDALAFVGDITPEIERATLRALNKAADFARTDAQRRILEQVAFPASYLSASGGRLTVSERARPGSLQAVVTGRGRPTSLAEFAAKNTPRPGERTATGNLRRSKGGAVAVTVKPGQRASIKRAFLVNLKNGNTGLAVRTEGGPPKGAYKPKQLGPNLWLLYGPSVNQVLLSVQNGGGVIEEIQPEVLYVLQKEFNRQLDLKGV